MNGLDQLAVVLDDPESTSLGNGLQSSAIRGTFWLTHRFQYNASDFSLAGFPIRIEPGHISMGWVYFLRSRSLQAR